MWLVDDSVERCEYKVGRIVEIFNENDVRPACCATSENQMAQGVLNLPVEKSAPAFCDGVSEVENRARDVRATSNRLQKPSDSR